MRQNLKIVIKKVKTKLYIFLKSKKVYDIIII